MTRDSENIWNVLGRYFDGSMRGSDEWMLNQWLEQDEKNREMLEFMKQVKAAGGDIRDEEFFSKIHTDRDWETVKSHIRSKRSREKQKKIRQLKEKRKKQEMVYGLIKVAALLLVAFTSAYLAFEFVYTPAVEAERQEMAVLEEVSTNRGERANITLGDGTKVSLNVDSKLLIPGHFGHSERRVILEGEAFFEVTEDPDRPFLIESHGSVTEVLGTSFGVRSYRNDGEVKVVVKSGLVSLSKNPETGAPETEGANTTGEGATVPSDKLLLEAGDIGVFKKDDFSLTTDTDWDAGDLLGWMDSRLIFREATLGEIFVTLERWFDVRIETELSEEEMNRGRITLNMRKGHVRDVFELLNESVNLQYELRDDDQIVVR